MQETLSEKQQLALDNFILGNNIFLTGPGGSGKTFLIKKIVEKCNENLLNVQVCALTGCAAVLLECKAKTIHSWGGIGLANGEPIDVVKRVCKSKYKRGPWKNVDVLIIDEVSMMSKKIFDILNKIAQVIRKSTEPFGGIQLVFSGDFYQLPPVGDEEDPESCQFCFESVHWKKTFPISIQLSKIFRQNDNKYVKALNQIRKGIIKRSSYDLLCGRLNKECNDEIRPTILLPLKRKVDFINSAELKKIKEEEKIFETAMHSDEEIQEKQKTKYKGVYLSPENIEHEISYLKNSIMADSVLKLKKGALVMCVANIDMESENQIVNGSQGIVVDFDNNFPVVKFRNGVIRTMTPHIWLSERIPWVGIKQIPLILAWAITIHKAQGVTLDVAQIDAGRHIFECGQTYVALSRIKTIEGLYLSAFDPKKIKVNKKVKSFYEKLVV